MQLAADPIVIEIAGEAYELRPSLRAALRLVRRHGDFLAIYNAILADHVSVGGDVIREGSGSILAAADFLTACEIEGVRDAYASIKLPLLRFIVQLTGADADNQDTAKPPGKALPLPEFYATLFRVGTGWLGWSPADTWEATPAEILAAQHGRGDLIADVLKAVFGSADDGKSPLTYAPPVLNADGTDSALDRAGLAKLKGMLS